ncbi:MAG: helix-turn-helix domain-containing protein [Egibacteraceae bacterium]
MPEGELSASHRQLVARLRDLRRAAGLSGHQLGEQLGWTQSKVSKIETGRTIPDLDDLEAWAAATAASEEVHGELLDLLGGMLSETTAMRRVLRYGLRHKQEQVRELEATATTIDRWHPGMVPGLLQVPEYAAEVFGLAAYTGQRDVAAAVAARMQRQAILFDASKRIRVVLAESALRWRPGSAAVQAAQLDRIVSLVRSGAPQIGVIPLDAQAPVLYLNGFGLYDADAEAVVTVETYHAESVLRDPRDVAVYRQLFGSLEQAALFGAQARALVERLAEQLRDLDES